MLGVGLIPMETPLGPLAPAHMSEFFVGLALAAVVAIIVQKFVVPRFEQMYTERAAEIEGGINLAQNIRAEAEQTKRAYQQQLADSREEAAKLRDEARAQGAAIIAQAKEQAQAEAERIREQASQQMQVERDQTMAELRAEVATLATQLAERIIGETLTDSATTQRTVDRFLAELDAQPSRTVPDYVPEGMGQ